MAEQMAQEAETVRRAQGGDRAAFEALVLHYRPHAVRFAQSIVRDAFFAEDIAQESFARVWLRLATFKAGSSFQSWLFTIIRNRCIDHLRAQKPAAPLPEDWDPPGGDEPQERLARRENWQEWLAVYRRLPSEAQTALYLFAFEGMRYAEIAKVMGGSTAWVKMLIYRARKRMKREGGTAP